MKRFFTVGLKPDQMSTFLDIAEEYRVKAIPRMKNGFLYIVEGPAMCEGFRQKVRELVGFMGFHEYPSPPDGVSTSHARDVATYFPSPKAGKKK